MITTEISYIQQVVVTYTPSATITLAEACHDNGGRYYGTYSNSGSAFVVPSDLTVSEIKVVDGRMQISDYATGDIVPMNTGVMMSSATAGEHTLCLSNEAGTSVLGTDNMLKASGTGINASEMGEAAPNCTYYRLTMHKGETLGFYWGAASGAAFGIAANKAYLAVPNNTARLSGFDMSDGGQTGVSVPTAVTAQTAGVAYNLHGLRVGAGCKGLVIINGKKMKKSRTSQSDSAPLP